MLAEYDDLDATAMAELVHRGQVHPRELVEAAIERAEARNPALNAIIHRQFERARGDAEQVASSAPFAGVPFLFKDWAEVDRVRAKVDPLLARGFEERGLRMLGVSGVGFAYLMGDKPLRSRADMAGIKLWVPQNDAIAIRTFELGGPAVMTFEDILKLVLRETFRTRALLPLPFFAARILGGFAQLTALFGFKPALTRDQMIVMESDSVVSGAEPGLAELGVEPTGIDAVAASYLWRYRRGGQFADAPAA